MAEENTNVNTTENTAPQETTFTQAQVDVLIQKRLDRERKKYPTEDELTAFRTWQGNQKQEQQNLASITQERDTATAQLAQAQAELEQMKREKYVAAKGLTGDEAEFITYKASKMVTDKVTFEKAVDELVADRKPAFDWTGSVGDGSKTNTVNGTMNALIRGAVKR